jgi:hypothetical protein
MIALAFTSCNKWIDTGINVDPDSPSDVPMNLLLPSVEARFAFTLVQGNDGFRTLSLWDQQMTGIARQSQSEGAYVFRSGDANNNWGALYAGFLMDAKQLMDKAAKADSKSPYYEGAAKVITAAGLGYASDLWGDIPYSEALKGSDNLTPKFDTQESIYAAIQKLLNEAIADFSLPPSANVFPMEGDIIFEGNAAKWLQACYALKARYALHLSKRDPNAYATALGYLSKAFTSNAGNMYYYYGTSNNNGNPLYLFMTDRGDIRVSKLITDTLTKYADPRLPQYANPITDTVKIDGVVYPPGSYVGAPNGEPLSSASQPGPGIASINTPTPIITYAEVAFMTAECKYKTGDEAGAKLAAEAGLKASLDEYGVFDAAWFTGMKAKIDAKTGDDLFKFIMLQKYIALMYNFEAYNDWRRTGLPALTPNPKSGGKEIPRRFPYPTDALTYNPNTPQGVTIWDHIWWDK